MKKWKFPLVPPLLLAGILLVLVPIFTFMTLDRLERQKEFFTQRLLERGASLIQTFEAGTRTGMLTMSWGAQRIQAMLYETALQPEVLYLFITTREGKILAHSDASKVGQVFAAMPDIKKMSEDETRFFHRVQPYTDPDESFEIYKRFIPVRMKRTPGGMGSGMRRHDHMRKMFLPGSLDKAGGIKTKHDWSRPYARFYISPGEDRQSEKLEHYIFAGFSMEKEIFARKRFVRQTIWRGFFFFLFGGVGIVALFAFQAYRGAKDSLSRVKAFSDNVIHHMPAGLVTIQADHRVSSMNQAARNILDGTIKKAFPQWLELISQFKDASGMISREVLIETAQGKSVLLDTTASPIKDADGQITGFLFLFKDLTQVKELKKEVETNKRLAAIGKLAAGVAHEIRNPLSSIKGFATYFGKRFTDNDADRQTAQVMVDEVERINRSITQLLEFAKPMAVEKKQVAVKQMIDHSLALVQYDLDQKQIQAAVKMDSEVQEIFTDGGRINQVLLNLYINAIQAMDEGGKLDIRVAGGAEEGWVDISVKDSGSGIDPDALDLIFDPYFTTRPTGTGLGLSIVHRIIENLGGHIQVKSDKGQGACFTISLPVSQKEETS